MILVANDEKKYVHAEFKKQVKKGLSIEKLELADIVVGNVIIERKQINDLYSSVLDGRLFKQLSKMAAYRDENPDTVPILLIEGQSLKRPLAKYKYIFSLESIKANIVVVYGIQVINTKTLADTVRFIKEIDRYSDGGKHVIKNVRAFKRKKSIRDQRLYFLQGLPTIGPDRAKQILDKYNTPMEYFQRASVNKQIEKVLR